MSRSAIGSELLPLVCPPMALLIIRSPKRVAYLIHCESSVPAVAVVRACDVFGRASRAALCVHSLSSSTACVCVLYKSIITDHRSTRHALLIRLIFCVSCRKRPNNSRLVRASSFFFVKDSNNASWSFVPADFTNQWHSQFIWYASLMELEAKIHLPTSLS